MVSPLTCAMSSGALSVHSQLNSAMISSTKRSLASNRVISVNPKLIPTHRNASRKTFNWPLTSNKHCGPCEIRSSSSSPYSLPSPIGLPFSNSVSLSFKSKPIVASIPPVTPASINPPIPSDAVAPSKAVSTISFRSLAVFSKPWSSR